MDRARESQLIRRIRSDVVAQGCAVVFVGGGDGLPGWGYSIGLFERFKHPEVVVFGLEKDVSLGLLEIVLDNVRVGISYQTAGLYPDLIEGVLCTFRSVEKSWYRPLLGRATRFYGGINFPVIQCVWPDNNQVFPWQPGFREDWRWAQPLLDHADPVEANAQLILNSLRRSN